MRLPTDGKISIKMRSQISALPSVNKTVIIGGLGGDLLVAYEHTSGSPLNTPIIYSFLNELSKSSRR